MYDSFVPCHCYAPCSCVRPGTECGLNVRGTYRVSPKTCCAAAPHAVASSHTVGPGAVAESRGSCSLFPLYITLLSASSLIFTLDSVYLSLFSFFFKSVSLWSCLLLPHSLHVVYAWCWKWAVHGLWTTNVVTSEIHPNDPALAPPQVPQTTPLRVIWQLLTTWVRPGKFHPL